MTDSSEDSSYIVNYLLSVIKKEYFSKPKRAPIESFEAALHKGNLALSKIAEHGNVAWIGKLNAIIAIIEKNNLHLTQAGDTSAFLFRSNLLTNVSEGLSSPEAASNPLKTFVNVSSGRMEKTDKLIITTESIFDIFSLEEIKKSIIRFSRENFVQFLKTALVNELEKAAVLVVDFDEKALPAPMPKPAKKNSTANVFSQSAFKKETQKAPPVAEDSPREILEEITKEKVAEEKDPNKSVGHIYIKETVEPEQRREIMKDTALAISEKFENIQASSAQFFKKLASHTARKTLETSSRIRTPRIEPEKVKLQFAKVGSSLTIIASKIFNFVRAIKWEEYYFILRKGIYKLIIFCKKFKPEKNPFQTVTEQRSFNPIASERKNKFYTAFSTFAPHPAKIKNLILRLNYQQRLYALLILILIIVVPFLIMRKSAPESAPAQPTQTTTQIAENPNQDKNIVRLESLNSVYSDQDILKLVNLNDSVFAVSQTQIANVQSKDTTAIPADFGKVKLATGMDDLGLIFIINTENKILSHSPASKKFQDNVITFPADANIVAVGTYLTYLYTVDAKNNQIYRFPRATGGFGEKTNWLKDTIDLSQAENIALNDNIFIIDNGSVIKLFRGAKQDFTIEDTYHPIVPAMAYAKPGSENVFILDTQNSKIAKLDANGKIQAQYFNADIEKATDFSISEASSTAYLLIGNDVKTFNLNR